CQPPHGLCHHRLHRARAAPKRPKPHSSITPTTATAHSPRPPHGGPEAWPPVHPLHRPCTRRIGCATSAFTVRAPRRNGRKRTAAVHPPHHTHTHHRHRTLTAATARRARGVAARVSEPRWPDCDGR